MFGMNSVNTFYLGRGITALIAGFWVAFILFCGEPDLADAIMFWLRK